MLRIFSFVLFLCVSTLYAVGIKGIYITDDKNTINTTRAKIDNVVVDLNLKDSEKLAEKLTPFIGETLDDNRIIAMRKAILNYYISQGKLFIEIQTPKQSMSNGIVQFYITQKPYGRSIFKGDKFYSDEKLSRFLAFNPGEDIAADNLQNNLSWLNRNPFQSTTMKLVPNPQTGMIDIEFLSKKRRSIRFYERVSNAGTLTTGYGRFSTGFSWGNAFGIGDILSFEWTCSDKFSAYQTFGAAYSSLLPWKNVFDILGAYAIVKPIEPNMNVTAKSVQIRPRYTIPIKPLFVPLQQSVACGFDYKYTNSNIVVLPPGGAVQVNTLPAPIFKEINITQLYLNYTLYDTIDIHNIALSVDFYCSPGELIALESNENYNKNRKTSNNLYCYTNITASDVITIPKVMQISLLARGQISSNTLPSTELKALGGYDTVRGYHQAEYSTDNAFIGNIELRSLPIRLMKKFKDQLIFLAFLDVGYGSNWFLAKVPAGKPQPPKGEVLIGTGPGLRYQINPYLQMRADYGFLLRQLFIRDKHVAEQFSKVGAFHFGALMSF